MQALIAKHKELGFMVTVAVLASIVAATTWFLMGGGEEGGPILGATPDMPVYSSIEELSAESDLAVVGKIKRVSAREVDYGTSDLDERTDRIGIPTVFYEVEVVETILGREPGDTIVVGTPDMDAISIRESTALQPGQQVVLFLKRRTRVDAPGITSYDEFYVTVSMDNGVFDVPTGVVGPVGRVNDDAVAVPRGRNADMFGGSVFTMSEIREGIEPDSGEAGPVGNTH